MERGKSRTSKSVSAQRVIKSGPSRWEAGVSRDAVAGKGAVVKKNAPDDETQRVSVDPTEGGW